MLLPSLAVGEIEFGMQKAPDVRPDKRQELRSFIARFAQLPFDEHCVQPYAAVRAELWRTHGTRVRGKPHKHKERRPEDLSDKVTGAELGVDEPDLLIASIALAQNLVLVTDDRNVGMSRVKDAADADFSALAISPFSYASKSGWNRLLEVASRLTNFSRLRRPDWSYFSHEIHRWNLHAPGVLLRPVFCRRARPTQHRGRVGR